MSGTAAPRRIQRRRTKGWRMPAGAVYVGRPSGWGNPYRPASAFESAGCNIPALTLDDCVQLYRERLERVLAGTNGRHLRDALKDLRGRDLACWCALDAPCHADVLLDLANGEIQDEG